MTISTTNTKGPTSAARDGLSRRAALQRLGGGGLAAVLLAHGLQSASAQEATPGAARNYMVIRQYQLVPGAAMDELVGIVESGFVPIITQVPGFVAYSFLDAGEELAAVSVFTDLAGVEESTRRAADFVAQNLARFFQGPPTMLAGFVRIDEEAE